MKWTLANEDTNKVPTVSAIKELTVITKLISST